MLSRYIKKGIYALILPLVMVFVLSAGIIVNAEDKTGWKNDGKGWYYVAYESGEYYVDSYQEIDGKLYYFGTDGYMKTGWIKFSEYGTYFYADNNGVLKENGWLLYKGEYYYFSDKYMVTGLEEIDGIKYYFAEDGHMIKGWYKDSSGTYHLAYKNGHAVSGWYLENGKYYYLDEYCNMYEGGAYSIDDKSYYFDEDGVLRIGWFKDEWDNDRYSDKDGVLHTGWVKYGKDYYYIDEGYMCKYTWVCDGNYYVGGDGKMIKNQLQYYSYGDGTGSYYYLGSDGKVVTSAGWRQTVPTRSNEDVRRCYLRRGGRAAVGWEKIGTKWYYFNHDGTPNTGLTTIDGKNYMFDAHGAMVTGWYNYTANWYYGDNWYYADSDGNLYDGFLKYNGSWYYFLSGKMCTGDIGIYDVYGNSTNYYAKSSGELVYGWYCDETVDAYGQKFSSWYYTDPKTGQRYTGWVKSGKDWYYINNARMIESGSYICAEREENSWEFKNAPKRDNYISEIAFERAYDEFLKNNTYVFDDDGKLVSGWYVIDTTLYKDTYYAKADGKGYDGWLKSGKNYYYFERGHMLVDCNTPDGYYVDANGVCK